MEIKKENIKIAYNEILKRQKSIGEYTGIGIALWVIATGFLIICLIIN